MDSTIKNNSLNQLMSELSEPAKKILEESAEIMALNHLYDLEPEILKLCMFRETNQSLNYELQLRDVTARLSQLQKDIEGEEAEILKLERALGKYDAKKDTKSVLNSYKKQKEKIEKDLKGMSVTYDLNIEKFKKIVKE